MGIVTPIRDDKPRTVTEWRNYISEPWQKAVESIIETGKRLIEAKESVAHGEWIKIFEGNKPFSRYTADKLMAIARHPVLANVAPGQHLPPSWTILFELSQIQEDTLSEMIQEGLVHHELTRAEAYELK